MPAETHQVGHAGGAEDVFELLCVLLADDTDEDPATATLSTLGVDAEDLGALWDAVCEEFAERSLGPELEPDVLDPSMTLEAAALTMAAVLMAAASDGC